MSVPEGPGIQPLSSAFNGDLEMTRERMFAVITTRRSYSSRSRQSLSHSFALSLSVFLFINVSSHFLGIDGVL